MKMTTVRARDIATEDLIAALEERGFCALMVRREVREFARAMEAKLVANDHKGGWRGDSAPDLHKRLVEESAELKEALHDLKTSKQTILHEAADVANFAMMIADVRGALFPTAETGSVSAAPVGLYWHCTECGDHHQLDDEQRANGYEDGDSERCIECGDGTSHVMTVKRAAAYEQGRALGLDKAAALERALQCEPVQREDPNAVEGLRAMDRNGWL